MVELKQGSTLKSGKYKIVKTLGQGSFGITYLATTRISMDGQLGKMNVNVNVTIKEFFMSDLNNRATDGTSVEKTSSSLVKNYLGKFQREAENLSKLNHPNIVKVLEVFDENNTTYYVMEFIDGETVDDYIKRNGKLTEEESLQITQEVCSALSYMHNHKMLHLDLKPKNIMRDSDGHIFLIDFGLAKQYNEDGEPESSTTLGLGTPGYAPIEQAHYKQDGSFPVTLDIYAVGASLYKMLTGKTPPESSYILNDGLPLSSLQQAGVSDKVIAVVEKAMAPIKKDRYQTVDALSRDIAALPSMDVNDEQTSIGDDVEEKTAYDEPKQEELHQENKIKENVSPKAEVPVASQSSSTKKYWLLGLAAIVLLLGIILAFTLLSSNADKSDETLVADSSEMVTDESLITNSDAESDEMAVREEERAKAEAAEAKAREEAKKQEEARRKAKEEEQKKEEARKKEELKAKEEAKKNEVQNDNQIYQDVDQMPTYPGGSSAYVNYLQQNLRYPAIAMENGIQGKVMVSFVVDKDGSVTEVQVVNPVDPSLDKEAVRVVRNMPKWVPGKKDDKSVRVRYTLPITFRLQ